MLSEDFSKMIAEGYQWILGAHPGEEIIRFQTESIEPRTMQEVRRRLLAGLPEKPQDTQQLLHRARSAMLREMPGGAETFLSAGCGGAWFFDWIKKTYGPTKTHIGLEYYMPVPTQLPANAKWIQNTCSDMSAVESESCDLVFSGQNYEHLWPDELLGFMLEAARVTKKGGHLVIDSPNREITQLLNWTHPEHTVEATPGEASEAMRLAGFDVSAVKGIWLCRDARTGAVLSFETVDQAGWTTTERLVAASNNPNDAFIWWIEGRRADREPDKEALSRVIAQIFRTAWPQRLRRTRTEIGRMVMRNTEPWYEAPKGTPGALMFGPYAPLRAGRYTCVFHIEVGELPAGTTALVCDVLSVQLERPIAQEHVVSSGPHEIVIDFELDKLVFGIEFRCLSTGAADVACRASVDLHEPARTSRAEALGLTS